jgi:hypothetical protein
MIRYNKSKTYLLPLMSELINLDPKFFYYLENTYISDDLNKYENCILILHNFSFKNPEFTAYEHALINNNYFVELIDINDKVLYVFKFPEEYMNEYNLFKIGKYSQFGKDVKTLILNFYTSIYQNNMDAVGFLVKIKQILFKEDKLKKEIEEKLHVKLDDDAELTDRMIKDDETFKLSEIINNKENVK